MKINIETGDASLERVCIGKSGQEVRQGTSVKQPKIVKPRCIISRKYERTISKVEQIDGITTQTIVSACEKIAASAKPWKVGTTSQVDHWSPSKTRNALLLGPLFGLQWAFGRFGVGSPTWKSGSRIGAFSLGLAPFIGSKNTRIS